MSQQAYYHPDPPNLSNSFLILRSGDIRIYKVRKIQNIHAGPMGKWRFILGVKVL